jgi:hypothetical protein
MVARVKASTLVLESSNVTVACRLSKLTVDWLTPGTLLSAFFTVIGHTSQSIEGIDNVTVLEAAQTGVLRTVNATATKKIFMIISQ